MSFNYASDSHDSGVKMKTCYGYSYLRMWFLSNLGRMCSENRHPRVRNQRHDGMDLGGRDHVLKCFHIYIFHEKQATYWFNVKHP